MAQTMFEKYGGFAAVSRIVLDFYERALDSDAIGEYFEDVDMKKLVDHQTKFVSSLLGGPASYTDERLKQIHAHLEISDDEFREMKDVFAETLSDHGMSAEDTAVVVAGVEARRAFIVA
ncbi:MAG: group 1 truncated hemoglobin [Pseudomonadota bacterium]